jgi:hypothetical protein
LNWPLDHGALVVLEAVLASTPSRLESVMNEVVDTVIQCCETSRKPPVIAAALRSVGRLLLSHTETKIGNELVNRLMQCLVDNTSSDRPADTKRLALILLRLIAKQDHKVSNNIFKYRLYTYICILLYRHA